MCTATTDVLTIAMDGIGMILPTVTVTAFAALSSVPALLMAGAVALGETKAVLMVAGNVVQNPTGLFEPVRALTAAYVTGSRG
jgi:ABC-type phosphate transport system permease subunit